MKILVTGATGFLGGWILSMLCDEFGKENVVGTGRNPQRTAELQNDGYEIIPGDLSDAEFVKKSFKDCTHLVHCAALSSPWGSYAKFYKNNVVTTLNLLNGIERIERFIYISTPTVYFNFSDRLNIKESDPLPKKFANAYAATKYIAEQKLLAHTDESMVRAIIRPRAIIGAGDTVIVPRVIRAYESGNLKIIGDGENIVDFSSAKNIGHACILAIKADPKINGKIFNITDDDPKKLWDTLRSTLNKMNLSTDLKKINYRLVYTIAALSEFFNKTFSGKEPTLTKYGIGVLKYSVTLDISEAKKHLGYTPVISTEESIDEFVKWYNAKEQ